MNKFLLFTLLITFQICYSQETNFTIEKSKLFREPYEKTELIKSFQDKEGGVYTVRYYDEFMGNSYNTTKGFIVQHWDSEQKSLSYKNYIIEIDKKSYISDVFFNQDKLHVLEYAKNKKNKTIDCFVHIPLQNKNQFERKKVFSIDVKKFPNKNQFKRKKPNSRDVTHLPNFIVSRRARDMINSSYKSGVVFSQKENYILFYVNFQENKEKYKLLVFNNKLEPVWNKEFTHAKAANLFDLEDIEIDNNGKVYLLGKVFHVGRKNRYNGKINYHFELFKINSEIEQRYATSTKEHFVNTLDLIFNEERIDCIGFFSEKSENKIKGIVFLSVDKSSMKEVASNFQKFTLKFMQDKYAEERHKELKNYYIKSMKVLKNGGYIITAEEFYTTTNNNMYGVNNMHGVNNELGVNNKPEVNKVTYHFDDIIVLRLSKSGDLVWARNINKKQAGYNKTLSYSSFVDNENIYLFLNAHKKMGELAGNRKFFNSSFFGNLKKGNSNLYAIIFDKKGNWKTSIIQSNRDSDVIFNVKNGVSLNGSKIILFGSDKEMKQFLTVGLE